METKPEVKKQIKSAKEAFIVKIPSYLHHEWTAKFKQANETKAAVELGKVKYVLFVLSITIVFDFEVFLERFWNVCGFFY